jgi:ArsR family transcriptional regulator
VNDRGDPTAAMADLLAAAADPARLRILGSLAAGERCVCDIQARVPLPASLLSYHLRVLREAELIEARRRGRWIDYRLAPTALERLHAALPALHQPGRLDSPRRGASKRGPRQLPTSMRRRAVP